MSCQMEKTAPGRAASGRAAKCLKDEFGGNVLGVILTGMGRDGADGALALHERGAYIIAESRETCVVYGMPRAAVELGAVDELLPLPEIPGALVRNVGG